MAEAPSDRSSSASRVARTALERLAEEIGIDVIGAAPARPYEETEQAIHERRARGLFADMRFTMARPDVSCHPELLLPGARTVISAAQCYYVPGDEPQQRGQVSSVARAVQQKRPDPRGRLPRYTWWDAYAELRERLDALGRRLGGSYRVLVDANQHVDREGAVRAGVGFYGKNTMLITRRHGSWVILGTLVTDIEVETASPVQLDCGSCTLCIEACPTGALDEPGVLDAERCLSYWTQSPRAIPEEYRADLGDQVYGCDICQDVCPWNRGVEKRRAADSLPDGAEPSVSLLDWLTCPDSELRERYDRLYVPRNDPRFLRRNALVALGNVGQVELRALAERYADSDDAMLREHAEWALARLRPSAERAGQVPPLEEGWAVWAGHDPSIAESEGEC